MFVKHLLMITVGVSILLSEPSFAQDRMWIRKPSGEIFCQVADNEPDIWVRWEARLAGNDTASVTFHNPSPLQILVTVIAKVGRGDQLVIDGGGSSTITYSPKIRPIQGMICETM